MKVSQILVSSILISLVLGSGARSQPTGDVLATLKNLNAAQVSESQLKALQKQYDAEKMPARHIKLALALGIAYFRANLPDKGAPFLEEAVKLKTHLDDYAQYYLGLISRDHKDLEGAKRHFSVVKNHHPPSLREADAEMELARLARTQNQWREAYQLLTHLERRHRGDSQYQDILFDLIEASVRAGHGAEACRAALKLYSKYPTYTLPKKWNADLSKVQVAGKNLGCVTQVRDIEKRLHQLTIAGEFEEVRTELRQWLELTRAGGKPHPDILAKIEGGQGELALAEGKIKDAITHFLTAQDVGGKTFSTQMLLSKAYAQTDNYASAVEGYVQAFALSPRSQQGLHALFQAAFLSYQNLDYDGAARRFEEIVRRGRGKITWDARWHLAWIRYLKADYEGATKEFLSLYKSKHYRAVDLEKLQYWHAMSEFRNGNIEIARGIFSDLASRKRLGYYTAAAQSRLVTLPAVVPGATAVPTPSPAATLNPSPSPVASASASPSGSPSPLASPSLSPSPSASASPTATPSRAPSSIFGIKQPEADEELGGEPKEDEENEENQELQTPPGGESGELVLVTPLKNPLLNTRFERAEDLIDLGFDTWAIAELHEIERRTSNHDYLKTLMNEYLRAGDFYRSAYIADSIFESEREKTGIDGDNRLWRYAFPEAYFKYVTSSSRRFDVSPFLVWSIMRGESGFREEIHSIAGAMGLMQMIPPTARNVAKSLSYPEFANFMLLTPETNILFGTKYLQRLQKTMSSSLPLVIASYNAGPHRILGWLKDFGDLDMDEFIEHIPYQETRNYVKKVVRNFFVYQSLYDKKSSSSLKWLAEKVGMKFKGPKPLSEDWDE